MTVNQSSMTCAVRSSHFNQVPSARLLLRGRSATSGDLPGVTDSHKSRPRHSHRRLVAHRVREADSDHEPVGHVEGHSTSRSERRRVFLSTCVDEPAHELEQRERSRVPSASQLSDEQRGPHPNCRFSLSLLTSDRKIKTSGCCMRTTEPANAPVRHKACGRSNFGAQACANEPQSTMTT